MSENQSSPRIEGRRLMHHDSTRSIMSAGNTSTASSTFLEYKNIPFSPSTSRKLEKALLGRRISTATSGARSAGKLTPRLVKSSLGVKRPRRRVGYNILGEKYFVTIDVKPLEVADEDTDEGTEAETKSRDFLDEFLQASKALLAPTVKSISPNSELRNVDVFASPSNNHPISGVLLSPVLRAPATSVLAPPELIADTDTSRDFLPKLTSIPIGISKYISPSTPLPSTSSLKKIRGAAVATLTMCRLLLDQRCQLQTYWLHHLDHEVDTLLFGFPKDEVFDFIPDISFEKILVDLMTTKYGSQSLCIVQTKVVHFLEALLQHESTFAVVRLVRHILLPNASDKTSVTHGLKFADNDEGEDRGSVRSSAARYEGLSEMSLWLLIQARQDLQLTSRCVSYFSEEKQRSFLRESSGLFRSATVIQGGSSHDRVNRIIVSKSSAVAVTIDLVRKRGKYGPRFIDQVLTAVLMEASVNMPSTSHDTSELNSSGMRTRINDDDLVDLESYLLTFALSFARNDRQLQLLDKKLRLAYPDTLREVFFQCVRADEERTGMISVLELRNVLSLTGASAAAVQEVLSACLSMNQTSMTSLAIFCYLDLWGIAIASYSNNKNVVSKGRHVRSSVVQASGSKIALDTLMEAIRTTYRGADHKAAEDLLIYVSLMRTSSTPNPQWLISPQALGSDTDKSKHISTDGDWRLLAIGKSNEEDVDDVDGANDFLVRGSTAILTTADRLEGGWGRSAVDLARISRSNTAGNSFQNSTTNIILPTIRDLTTASGEIARFPLLSLPNRPGTSTGFACSSKNYQLQSAEQSNLHKSRGDKLSRENQFPPRDPDFRILRESEISVVENPEKRTNTSYSRALSELEGLEYEKRGLLAHGDDIAPIQSRANVDFLIVSPIALSPHSKKSKRIFSEDFTSELQPDFVVEVVQSQLDAMNAYESTNRDELTLYKQDLLRKRAAREILNELSRAHLREKARKSLQKSFGSFDRTHDKISSAEAIPKNQFLKKAATNKTKRKRKQKQSATLCELQDHTKIPERDSTLLSPRVISEFPHEPLETQSSVMTSSDADQELFVEEVMTRDDIDGSFAAMFEDPFEPIRSPYGLSTLLPSVIEESVTARELEQGTEGKLLPVLNSREIIRKDISSNRNFHLPRIFAADIEFTAFQISEESGGFSSDTSSEAGDDERPFADVEKRVSEHKAETEKLRIEMFYDSLYRSLASSQDDNSGSKASQLRGEIKLFLIDRVDWNAFFDREVANLPSRNIHLPNTNLTETKPMFENSIEVDFTTEMITKSHRMRALVEGKVISSMIKLSSSTSADGSNSRDYFTIAINPENWPCLVTIEVMCLDGSLRVMIGEGYIPSVDRNDQFHEISANPLTENMKIKVLQISHRPNHQMCGKVYVSVGCMRPRESSNESPSIKDYYAHYKIWGIVSSPTNKVTESGLRNVSKIIQKFNAMTVSQGRVDDISSHSLSNTSRSLEVNENDTYHSHEAASSTDSMATAAAVAMAISTGVGVPFVPPPMLSMNASRVNLENDSVIDSAILKLGRDSLAQSTDDDESPRNQSFPVRSHRGIVIDRNIHGDLSK